jgi:hypothetical protein
MAPPFNQYKKKPFLFCPHHRSGMISGIPYKKQQSHLASGATTTEQKTRIHQDKSIVPLSTIATTTERKHIKICLDYTR